MQVVCIGFGELIKKNFFCFQCCYLFWLTLAESKHFKDGRQLTSLSCTVTPQQTTPSIKLSPTELASFILNITFSLVPQLKRWNI